MEPYFEILLQCPLFDGIRREELAGMLTCLGGQTKTISKGSPVFLEGDPARFLGIVLSGAVQIVRDDYYGARSVLTVVQPGGLFGEAFSCAGLDTMPVSVMAWQTGAVLLLDAKRVLTGLLQRLPLPQPADPQSAAGHGPKEPGTDAEDPVYVEKNHEGEADGIPSGSGKAARRLGICHPL